MKQKKYESDETMLTKLDKEIICVSACWQVCTVCGWGLGGPSLFKNFYSTILITQWFLGTSDSSASDTTREGVDRSTRAWESRQRQESETYRRQDE